MMKNLAYGYYNKKGEYKIVHTINSRLINAIHQGLDRNNGLVNIYVNIDFSQLDTIITISRMVDFDGEYLYHVNCEYKNCHNSIECCENEIKRAIEMIIDWFDEVNNYKTSEEVETITTPEENTNILSVNVKEERDKKRVNDVLQTVLTITYLITYTDGTTKIVSGYSEKNDDYEIYKILPEEVKEFMNKRVYKYNSGEYKSISNCYWYVEYEYININPVKPEEVEEVPTTTQTQKNNVVSIPENIKVYGTISEYFVEGEGWINAKKATTKQVQNATQVSVNYKVYNPDGMIVNEGTEDFSIDRYHTLKKNTTHITYHVKKNNGTKTKTGLNKFDTITLWSGRINPDKRKSTLNMLHNKYKDCKFIRV